MHLRPTAAGLAVFLLCGLAAADDWAGWRGPRADGTATETGYPVTWDAKTNVRWKTPIPGSGHSSAVVSKGRVFVTSCVEDQRQRMLYCVNRASGKIEWERVVLTAELEKKHRDNTYASSTPAADGERVYVTFLDYPRVRVYSYDYAGNKLWEKSPGEFHSVHGFCSPPVLYRDLVIVNGDQDAQAYIVALDRKTGEERWRADRPNRTRSYCPPVVVEAAGRRQLVLTGSKSVASFDPDTGKQLWVVDGPTEQFVSSVVYHDGLILLTAGFPKHWVMAIDPSGSGNVTKTHIRWGHINNGGYVPSPVAHAGKFFAVDDKGMATCWDVKTGEKCWEERLSGAGHHASAVVAEGRVYFVADDGVTHVLKAADPFERLARNPLGEAVRSSPAFSDGEIFLRGAKHLFCISAKK
jgi:outer membrane protein assembly factor BamB